MYPLLPLAPTRQPYMYPPNPTLPLNRAEAGGYLEQKVLYQYQTGVPLATYILHTPTTRFFQAGGATSFPTSSGRRRWRGRWGSGNWDSQTAGQFPQGLRPICRSLCVWHNWGGGAPVGPAAVLGTTIGFKTTARPFLSSCFSPTHPIKGNRQRHCQKYK